LTLSKQVLFSSPHEESTETEEGTEKEKESEGKEKEKEKEGDDVSLTLDNLPELLHDLKDPNVQSISFELCGQAEKHLVGSFPAPKAQICEYNLLTNKVKYDFLVALKPLFITFIDGTIAPVQVGKYTISKNLLRCLL